MIRPYFKRLATALVAIILLSGLISCGGQTNTNIFSAEDGPPSQGINTRDIPDAVPVKTKRSRYGNPKSYVVFNKRYYVMSSSRGYKERGIASWYGSKFHGKRTSSGEIYNMHAMTAAHKTLPLPTYVKVTNLKNNRQVILKVNDRGPFHSNRLIDLSHTAAIKLGIKGTGTGMVEVEALNPGDSMVSKPSVAKPTPYTKKSSPIALYLQLGAFVNSHNAYQLKQRINTTLTTQQAYVSSVRANGQQFYRVRIGPLDTTQQADNLADTLTQHGLSQYRIIIE